MSSATKDARRRRGRRRGSAPADGPAEGGDALVALQAELVLLREENARLKAAELQEPDLGALLARARSLPYGAGGGADEADEAAQLLVEGMVMRESLLTLCRELARTMAHLEGRLTALGGTLDDAAAARS